jgi:hypothetical protein
MGRREASGKDCGHDLGTLSNTLTIVQTNAAGTNFFGATVASTAVVKGNIARVGVNFHF